MDKQRKGVIIDKIERNPGIAKTNLAKSVRGHMSMKTAFQVIEYLKQEGEIIERKHGKKKRYYPLDEDPEKLVDEINDFIKELSNIKEECSTYPSDLFDPIYQKIIRQREDLSHDMAIRQRDLDYDKEVDDIMLAFKESQSRIYKLLPSVTFRRSRKVNNCLGHIRTYLQAAASRYVTCKSERVKYGKSKKRDSLSEEIDHLETIITKLIRYTRGMTNTIESVEPKNLKRLFSPPLASDLEDAEQEMKKLQEGVKEMIDKIVKQRAMREGGEKLEAGLEKIKGMLENIAGELVAAQEELDEAYRANLISKAEQKLHVQIKEINDYIASLPPLDTMK